ncbi:DUF2690 domain-containing protein [Streptomyces sp. NPDC050788]|uniref:helix-turn-helix domain-containing protein n=1 Tax=Streptomyces sp. NPDC050788 TaxID=3155041 RepID=UPI00344607E8
MPRWRALPDELDPQVREFASQLRRLVDRSGLSIASVADRTGYSKTSWERYLNGRLLAPKGAIVALAEVTGTNPVHLTTMWELAERAWSRSEMRHDMTMEAIRISQARAALSEFGAPPADAKGGKSARRSGSATATPGVAGPAGVAPSVPSQPTAPEVRDSGTSAAQAARTSQTPQTGSSGGNSWGLAGYRGPAPTGARPTGTGAPAPTAASSADGAGWTPGTPSPYGEPPQGPRPGGGSSSGGGGRRRLTMFLAGVVGVLVVIAGVFFLADGGGGKDDEGGTKPSPSASVQTDLPPGVKCAGATCTGKDAEAMGCTKDVTAVTTAKTAVVGASTVEVRYSKTCGAAWGRITQAAQGDAVQVTAGGSAQDDSITTAGDTIAYTPMVAVKDAGEARACATLASGQKGCTK